MQVYLLLLSYSLISSTVGVPEVLLPDGLIRGRDSATLKGTKFTIFEKIPFAKPPIGELRFKSPQPAEKWAEPLDTLEMDCVCYQQNGNSDLETEDCLYINVYTPNLPTNGSNLTIPVMVFIHGGGFIGGSSRGVYGERFIDKEIVYVAFNYRLGPFGFLSTLDGIISGNNGLKDQQLALRWIHNNIIFFGGDPNQITIFGQSAGSASVAYQLLNQDNKGLFRAAILQSGTTLCPWAFQRNAREIAFKTASFLDEMFETNRNSTDLFNYLQKIKAKDIDLASEKYYSFANTPQTTEILQGFYWSPVVESENPQAFLTERMFGLLQNRKVVEVPIMIGMTSEEGLGDHQNVDDMKKLMEVYDNNLSWLVPNDMQILNETELSVMGAKIRDIYTNGTLLADHLAGGVRYCSDTSFSRPVIKHAEFYSKISDTYFYQFSYDGTMGHLNTQYDGAEHVGHGQDIGYFLCGGTGCDLTKYSESDEITSDRLVTLMTNFAKYLNPTPEKSDLLNNIIWPKVNTLDGDFLFLNINQTLEIQNHPKESTFTEWVNLYKSLGYNDFDTY